MKLHNIHINKQGVDIDGHQAIVKKDSLQVEPLDGTDISIVTLALFAENVVLDANLRRPAHMEPTPIYDQLAQELKSA